ncbi:MAG: hypothetical protein HC807_03595, partial [Gammaproteobacteria bacterium]|nr:hypothetical protein [Gammaproteobacteria bacterium]
PVLRETPGRLLASLQRGRGRVQYLAVGKSGIQFKRRFWEEDDWIYGGVTYTNIPQIVTIATSSHTSTSVQSRTSFTRTSPADRPACRRCR